jgi:anhydro-N-acetylmuramic acid kinase
MGDFSHSEVSERLIAGCMSGTSLDGIDIALVRIRGTGRGIKLVVEAFEERPWPASIREELLDMADPVNGYDPTTALSSAMHDRLAVTYSEVIADVVRQAGFNVADLDAVGNHGQTVYHAPEDGCTVQLGNPARMAEILGVTVVGDFREADVALGGQGAPLVPYMDWALFTDDEQHRLLLNLGGIANVTSLPPGAQPSDVIAFDTGPANMIVDALAQKLWGRSLDEGGEEALQGEIHEEVLDMLMAHDYFQMPPPKSTGRELFGREMVARFLSLTSHLVPADIMATAAAWTARSVSDAVRNFVSGRPSSMWVSGGGIHNRAIMNGLQSRFSGLKIKSLAAAGFDPDAKEAVCFALLAHEALNGVATGMPSVTGAHSHAFSGKICFSGRTN